MTQTTTTRTRAAAASSPAPRESVAPGDHPLGGSPESRESYVEVVEPAVVEPGNIQDATGGPDDEGGSLTDQDEALSDGSSIRDGSEFGPPDFEKLIELTKGHCRAPTQVTARGGAKVPCVCGKSIEECQRHATHRLNGRYRYPDGYYLPMEDVSRGYQGNGRVGTYYTMAQYLELERQDLEEMETIAQGMLDGVEDEEEATGLEPNTRVTFGTNETIEPRVPQTPPIAARLREDLSGLTRQGLATQRPSPTLWYGLIDVSGAKWIFQDLPKAQEYVDMKVFRFARVFESHPDALKWRDGSKAAGKPKAAEKPITIDSSDASSDDDDSSGNNSPPPKSVSRKSKKGKKGRRSTKTKEGRRGHAPRRSRAPSPPSSSSSSSEDFSSDSSSSDSSQERHRKKRNSKKKKKTSRHPKRKGEKRHERPTFLGNDPSEGNRKKVHDLPVNGKAIDKAAGPLDMRSKDSGELWNAAVDVTALPGMFTNIGSGGGDSYDEAQRTTEMAATLISTVIGKRAQIHDSLWKTLKRHAMGQVKNMESLFKFVKYVGKSERPAFEQQENALQVFMLPRNYDEDTTNEYTQNGFLPRLTRASFRYYMNLLSMVRQLAYDHPAFWEKGPAKAMLDFHSERLLQVRQNALTRKALILQTYTYLRDANAKSFYHESMTESLWDRLATLTVNPGGGGGSSVGQGTETPAIVGGGAAAVTAKPRCSHCRSAKLHELMRVRPAKLCCPVKDLSSKKAREVAKGAIEAWGRDPSIEGGFPSHLEIVKAELSVEGDQG
jgi:hypothetical protein